MVQEASILAPHQAALKLCCFYQLIIICRARPATSLLPPATHHIYHDADAGDVYRSSSRLHYGTRKCMIFFFPEAGLSAAAISAVSACNKRHHDSNSTMQAPQLQYAASNFVLLHSRPSLCYFPLRVCPFQRETVATRPCNSHEMASWSGCGCCIRRYCKLSMAIL